MVRGCRWPCNQKRAVLVSFYETALPVAFAMAWRNCLIALRHRKLCVFSISALVMMAINSRHGIANSAAQNKSGDEAMRLALASISSVAHGQLGMSQIRIVSCTPSPAKISAYCCGPSNESTRHGPGVCCAVCVLVVFIVVIVSGLGAPARA